MKNLQLGFAIITIFTVAIISCSSADNEVKKTSSETNEAKQIIETNEVAMLPSFKITDVDGNVVDLQTLKGKKVFVNLWATWCPPCRAEMPSIKKLYTKLDTAKVMFIMLSLDDEFEKAKRYANKNNLNLPVYYPTESLPLLFKTQGIPATFIFNEKGELIRQNMGADNYNTDEYLQLLKA
jgi:thiol-disulfide isomerase/thioredoxin